MERLIRANDLGYGVGVPRPLLPRTYSARLVRSVDSGATTTYELATVVIDSAGREHFVGPQATAWDWRPEHVIAAQRSGHSVVTVR